MENPVVLILASLVAILISTVFYITPRKLYIIIVTLPRDLRLIWTLLRLQLFLFFWTKFNYTVPKLFRKVSSQYPHKIAINFEGQKWKFREVDQFSNEIGHFFKSKGYKKGDSVALLMENKPEYICIWLGLAKIGVVTSFINTNLMSKEALVHAIKSGKGKAIIYDSKFTTLVQSATTLMPELKLYQYNDNPTEVLPGASDFRSDLIGSSSDALDEDIDAGKSSDTLIYIYTSGTTGLPKASVIKNSRYVMAYLSFKFGISIEKDDILYIPLPLYHGLGGMVGVSQCLIGGTTVVIKSKFSARNFWKDCEQYKCTIAQYIGEMARYVVLAHQNAEKTQYKLPKMFGNGMKPTTWKQIIKIFNVGQIYEFYGSTEGNFVLFNQDNTIGACGYIPVSADFFCPANPIKCDSSGEVIRNADGFCEICPYNEPGLLICKITDLIPMTKFDGYSDKKSTSNKILEDVLRPGEYFNTGDILSKDEFGYFYFRDRTGDTFRWKGENVSTIEVEEILTGFTHRTIAVYGVEVAGNEGKAGMAAIADPEKNLDLKLFLQECKSHLPAYSIPVFVRIVKEIPQTGTFKIQKTDLQKEGYSIGEVKDTIYCLHPAKKEYVELDSNLYNNILHNELRV